MIDELPREDKPVDTDESEQAPEEELPAELNLGDDRQHQGLDIVVENLKQPSRADLIVSGAIAIGLMRGNAKRDEEVAEELSELSAAGEISFCKSARISRKIGG